MPSPEILTPDQAAARIRTLITDALHGYPTNAAFCPAEWADKATPQALHLLNGRKSVIEGVIASIINQTKKNANR